ncbi:LuxR family transcriptional regulator [Hoyosella sp. G463]|uniref:LuxR family transcriptional regulator n=2 Tax=Lolliginicoccus lacisalsi TaxID=2742202 RepID=A0A927J9U8_9ACTN|nr:LuxR family transcriptional regulator [Lolliginicoccus lacisalsi]
MSLTTLPPTPSRGSDDEDRGSRPRPGLSQREEEVLVAWIKADTKEEVSRELKVAIGTINTYLARIRAKYAAVGRPASTKAALVARVLQDGIIDLDDL